MQIQWINSANQAFGFKIEFVRGALRMGPDLTIVAIAARLSRIVRGAAKWVTHFSDKFGLLHFVGTGWMRGRESSETRLLSGGHGISAGGAVRSSWKDTNLSKPEHIKTRE